MLAAEHCGTLDEAGMVAKLVAFEADVNARDERGRSALEEGRDLSALDYKDAGARDGCGKVAYILASRGADEASVFAARDVIIKKGFALFDTLVVHGQQEDPHAEEGCRWSRTKANGRPAGPPDA